MIWCLCQTHSSTHWIVHLITKYSDIRACARSSLDTACPTQKAWHVWLSLSTLIRIDDLSTTEGDCRCS